MLTRVVLVFRCCAPCGWSRDFDPPRVLGDPLFGSVFVALAAFMWAHEHTCPACGGKIDVESRKVAA